MGRPESTNRIMVEDCTTLAVGGVQDLPRHHWKSSSVDVTAICTACGRPWKVRLEAVKTRQGPRYVCPQCGRKVQKLYVPPGSGLDDLGCKICHDLAYACQYKKRKVAGAQRLWGS